MGSICYRSKLPLDIAILIIEGYKIIKVSQSSKQNQKMFSQTLQCNPDKSVKDETVCRLNDKTCFEDFKSLKK